MVRNSKYVITGLCKNTQWFVGMAVIVIIIVSIIGSNVSIRYTLGIIEPQTAVYDEKFIPALNKVASLIPKNETLVRFWKRGNNNLFH